MTDKLPELTGTSIEAAKAWFAAIHQRSNGGWHADDSPLDLDCFGADEATHVSEAIGRLRDAARDWPDPDYLYVLCADGPAAADTIWPGFVLDAALDSSRIGNPSIVGRTLPNVVFEDCSRFFMIEFGDPAGLATGQTDLRLYEVDGAALNPAGDPYTDLSNAVVNENSRIDFDNLHASFDQALAALTARSSAPAPRR